MSRSIAVIGSLNVDFITNTSRIPAAGETLTAISFDTGFGGKGANQAVACARLSQTRAQLGSKQPDVKTSMVGAVGDDSFGSDFIAALGKDGIDTTHIRRIVGQKTGIANIIVEEATGENRILLAANANHASGDELMDLVPQEADVVVFQLEIPLPLVVHNMALAHSQGKYVMLNPAPAQKLPDNLYPSVDCLIMNETETDILREAVTPLSADDNDELEAIAQSFFARGVKDLVIITLGSKGVYFSARQTPSQSSTPATLAKGSSSRAKGLVPARKVKVVDTTAAGDTFVGALAAQMARDAGNSPPVDPTAYVEFANLAAARTVQRSGATAAIPWLDEVV